MAFPVGALIAVAPQIIQAVGALIKKVDRDKINPKVKAGGSVGAIAGIVILALGQIPGAPTVPPGLEAAVVLLAAYIGAWIKKIPQ
jgi:hypothetical protein